MRSRDSGERRGTSPTVRRTATAGSVGGTLFGQRRGSGRLGGLLETRIAVKGLSKRFGDVLAVDAVTFDVQDGEWVTLLGPSGCGKTTTLRMIAGLEEGDAGEVSVSGRPMTAPARAVFVPPEKRGLGMVFQSYAIWPHMTVFENVAYPLRVQRLRKPEIERRVGDVLMLLGLGSLASRGATQLSGGQQQRVAMARAMVMEPDGLLLDEPLSNLDAKLRAQMRLELKSLQRRTGLATVYVTHDQAEALSLSDRIIVMHAGRIQQIGRAEDIYLRPANQLVAEFVGSINLIRGRSRAPSPGSSGYVVVATEGGRELAYRPPSGPDGRSSGGDDVVLAIRPEEILVRAGAGDPASLAIPAANQWPGRVEVVAYYGDHWEYMVAVGDHRFQVQTPGRVRLPRGSDVTLELPPEAIMLIGADAGPSAAARDAVALSAPRLPAP
jgi:iron(III) transport system ATP-binding protein